MKDWCFRSELYSNISINISSNYSVNVVLLDIGKNPRLCPLCIKPIPVLIQRQLKIMSWMPKLVNFDLLHTRIVQYEFFNTIIPSPDFSAVSSLTASLKPDLSIKKMFKVSERRQLFFCVPKHCIFLHLMTNLPKIS